MLDDKVAMSAQSVSETSAQDLTDAVNGLVQKGMKSCIDCGQPRRAAEQASGDELFLDPGRRRGDCGRAPQSKSIATRSPQTVAAAWWSPPNGTASQEIISGRCRIRTGGGVVSAFGRWASLWPLTPETAEAHHGSLVHAEPADHQRKSRTKRTSCASRGRRSWAR